MFAGVDSHKDLLVAAVVNELGRARDVETFVNNAAGHARLIAWVGARHGLVRVGVECSGSYGRQAALACQDAGLAVVEVPPHLTARDRRKHRQAGKNDEQDAVVIARIVAREDDLPPIRPHGLSDDLAALVSYRDHLVADRTRTANRTHALLGQIRPGYAAHCPRLTTKKALRAARRLVEADTTVSARLVCAQLERLEVLDTEIRARKHELEALVATSGTSLTRLCGVGTVVAARILGEVGDPGRFGTRHKFARTNGTAPVPASSGRTQRHRLNRGGNRQLNRAIHTIALTQIRHHPDARAYYDRKRKENKTVAEALRCLKRRVSDAVYRCLQEDARALLTT